MGRAGGRGPGGYESEAKFKQSKNINDILLPFQDRGLLNDPYILERQGKTYNKSHAQVGPASYVAPKVN